MIHPNSHQSPFLIRGQCSVSQSCSKRRNRGKWSALLWRSDVIDKQSFLSSRHHPPFFFFRSLPPPSTSPFYAGGPTRATASTFQPFNPRYRSPNTRAVTAANINARQSVTPTRATRGTLPSTIARPSRRVGN